MAVSFARLRFKFLTTEASINTELLPLLSFLKVPLDLEHLLIFIPIMICKLDSSIKCANDTNIIKFLYSYNGKIIPRRTDGALRYVGGLTRVLSVDRSITFAELMVKFGDLCGKSMSLKCKLPTEELDVLISVKSDGDLANVLEEYGRFSLSTNRDLKIRALMFPIKPSKEISPPPSPISPGNLSATKSKPPAPFRRPPAYYSFGVGSFTPAVGYPLGVSKGAGKVRCFPCCGQRGPRHLYGIPQWSRGS